MACKGTIGLGEREVAGSGFRYEIARGIRQRRKLLGLTIRQAADRTNKVVPYGRWSEYETGTRLPSLYNFLAVLRALGISQSPWQVLIESLLSTKEAT